VSIISFFIVLAMFHAPDQQLVRKSPSEFNRLRLNESLCYTGNGVFDNIREFGIGSVQAQIDSALYEEADNLLLLRGRILKRDGDGDPQPAAESGILIGTFENFPQDRSYTTLFQFDIRHFWSPDTSGRFFITTKVFPNDYICFVTQSSDTLVELYYSDIYNLSDLVK
jgi:hypothetical protein